MDQEFNLYNGKVKLHFKESSHRYTIYIDGKKTKSPSVTTITGTVDKSGPIQTWAIRNTIRVCRELIQPETRYSDAELEKVFEFATQESYKKKKEAAEIGTEVHKWIEDYLHGADMVVPAGGPQKSCILSFLTWAKEHNVTFLHKERPVYSLKYGVSGRLDGICLLDGKKSLIDFKSGNGIYPEVRLQVAAYQAFYEEEMGEEIDQRAVLRLGKEDGKFFQRIYPKTSFKRDFDGFLGALSLYKSLREIEKEDRKIEIITNQKDWIDEIESYYLSS